MREQKTSLEYIWLDGYAQSDPSGLPNLRSKIKVVPRGVVVVDNPSSFSGVPTWSFDGSSTQQAEGHKSDCILRPVFVCDDPFGFMEDKFVLCEVLNSDGTPHSSNTRAPLAKIAQQYESQEMWFALEQEYALYNKSGKWPLGWPENGYPFPQGRYYCGVGADVSFGRDVMTGHLRSALTAGLPISGTNAEVMPGQWEFQIGPGTAPMIADQMWMSRYILQRVAERDGITVNFSPKPIVEGDWNGTGCHVNFSNKQMRDKMDAQDTQRIADALRANIAKHLAVYGKGNEKRLTGKHETCSINDFRIGESDRGASIRIPPGVVPAGKGYLEDRRPAGNIDPYQVCRVLLETVGSLYA